jgi:hypothetical protein
MKKYISSLSDSEQARLKSTLTLKYIMAVLYILTLGLAIHVILFYAGCDKKTVMLSELFYLLAIGIIILITKYQARNLKEDLEQSSKTIVEYNIENKGYFEDDETNTEESVIRYFILSEGNRFIVDKALFDEAEKGDTLIKHFSTNEKEFLRYEIKKN